jgi:competence protein ComEC
MGEKVVAPVLWNKKIKEIDILVLSHPHPDHLNGLVSLINNFTVNEVWTNGEVVASEAFEAFENSIAVKAIRKLVISCEQPDRTIGDVTIEVLHPPPADVFRRVKSSHVLINNHSLVLRLVFKDVSILFTGDICETAERELMGRTHDLESTILKIPHHGSKTSSSLPFLKAVRPSIAILSVGYKNIFRHPNPTVIKRYQEQGCKLLRTDRDGAINIKTDGSTVRLNTFLE